jgi:peptidyl-prolyl cis-trans isomerase B (cyclophilin B)
VPSNKQRRQAAQRHLQRQLERRAELARKRRRNLLIGVTALAVVLVVGAVLLITGIGDDDPAAAGDTAASSSSAAPSSTAAASGTCPYQPAEEGGEVATPPTEPPTEGTVQLAMTTNFGPIGLTLDRAGAPCAAASFVHLTEQKFFDNTICHRETDGPGLKVLQCGDPTGTGTGGPGYRYPTQVSGDETYPRGTLAMANSGQGFDESQFFLVWGDSQLPPNYTVVGTIDERGLATLDAIAAKGNNGANGEGDGAPTEEVRIQSMTVAA